VLGYGAGIDDVFVVKSGLRDGYLWKKARKLREWRMISWMWRWILRALK
jgi:hypothetical protein